MDRREASKGPGAGGALVVAGPASPTENQLSGVGTDTTPTVMNAGRNTVPA